jgi:hypothetical protein
LRIGYDAGDYVSITVSSAGAVTLNAVGSAPSFTFSDPVALSSTLAVTGTTTLTGSLIVDNQVYLRTSSLYFDSYGTHAGFRNRRANGTLATPSETLSGDLLGFWNCLGYHGGGGGAKAFHTAAAAAIQMYAAEGYTPTAQGANIRFLTTPIGSTTSATRLYIGDNGFIGIGTITPTNILDIVTNNPRIRTARTPASATASGNQGEICWDANYIYVCTATNTWKRVAIATW